MNVELVSINAVPTQCAATTWGPIAVLVSRVTKETDTLASELESLCG